MAKLVVNPVVNLYGLRAGLSYISVENDKVRAIEAEAAGRKEDIKSRITDINSKMFNCKSSISKGKESAKTYRSACIMFGCFFVIMLVACICFIAAFKKVKVTYADSFSAYAFVCGALLGSALICVTTFIAFWLWEAFGSNERDSLLSAMEDIGEALFVVWCIFGIACGIATVPTFVVLGVGHHGVAYCGLLFAGIVYSVVFGLINFIRLCLNLHELIGYKKCVHKNKKRLAQLEQEASALAPVLKNEAEQTAAWRVQNLKPHLQNIFNMYAVLRQAFSFFLDERDWAHIDLLIFELETRRADSLKEALQLVDRELQTQRIENLICNATRAIVGTLRSGFSMLQQSLTAVYNGLSEQIAGLSGQISAVSSQIISSQAMNATLLSKANVTSEKMVNELKGIRANSDYARLRLG